MIDTHCHLNFERYDDDRDEVIQRAAEVGVTRIIIPSINIDNAHQVLALAEEHTNIFCAVGIHPNDTTYFDNATRHRIETISHRPKVVAIGEIGLDYHWDKSPKAKQQAAFETQLALAAERELPVIIHNRKASEDVMAILETWVNTLPESLQARPGVLHSFSAPPEIAERALAAGFYLGFTGPVTFKKADDLRAVVAQVPLERILVETDGPFLTPQPYRGKRNEPAYIPYIVEKIAEIKGETKEVVAETTTRNADELFKMSGV